MCRIDRALAAACAVLTVLGVSLGASASDDRKIERDRMVDEQIVARGVKDERVLEAMRGVRRHEFVPDEVKMAAYADRPLPISSTRSSACRSIISLMIATM